MEKKVVWTNLLFVLVLALVLLIFDYSLNLGDFHGVVYSLYLLYASALIFIVNAGIAIYRWQKDKEFKGFATGALAAPATGIILAYLGRLLF